MPTRQGLTTALMSALTGLAGWLLGLIELYVLSAALGAIVVGAFVVVRVRPGAVQVDRRLRPSIMTQGEPGHGRLVISNPSSSKSGGWFRRTPPVVLTERIGSTAAASIEIGTIPPGEEVTARYQIPTDRRGVVSVGPVQIERSDPFRLVRSTRTAVDVDEAIVAPATVSIGVPKVGSGVLGRQLAAAARRMGTGDFHALRDYVEGDEPRSIHWRASARTDDLKVRQFELPGLTHCTVVLDIDAAGYRGLDSTDNRVHIDAAYFAFERAVSVAASVVVSAADVLTTRLVVPPVIDVVGPTAAHDGLIELARVEPIETEVTGVGVNNDRTDGLGLVVVVVPRPSSALWAVTQGRRDPTITTVAVCVSEPGSQWNMVDATTVDRFVSGWRRLTGVDAPPRPPIDWDSDPSTIEQPVQMASDPDRHGERDAEVASPGMGPR